MRSTIAAGFVLLFVTMGCGTNGEPGSDEDPATLDEPAAVRATGERAGMSEGPPPISGDTITTDSGLRFVIIEPGDGPSPEPGDRVRVHYTGWLTSGEKFDSSRDRDQPFTFPLGQGRVIPGWDEGVAMMEVGERRRLILPPELAYGDAGQGNVIPPGATLVFDVELLAIEE